MRIIPQADKEAGKTGSLIIDVFGMQPLDDMSRMMLLEIIDRHHKSSTIIASQLIVEKWYDVIVAGIVAHAILDSLVHTSHKIELSGESMRKKRDKQTTGELRK